MRVLIVPADRTMDSGFACSIGDAWLTDCLVRAVVSAGHVVKAVDFGADRIISAGSEPRTRVGGAAGLAHLIAWSDLVIVGGGTLLQDDVGSGIGGMPRLTSVVSNLARALRRRCVFFGVGVDPVERRTARSLLNLAVCGRIVAARDKWSAERAVQLGAGGTLVAGDCIWLGAECSEARENFTRAGGPARQGAVLALARGDGGLITAKTIESLRQCYGRVTFLQMDQRAREGDAAGMRRGTLDHFDGVTERLSPGDALELMSCSEVVFTSRLHALYAAAVTGTPMVAVGGHRPKVAQFGAEFSIPVIDSMRQPSEAIGAMYADNIAIAHARSKVTEALAAILH